jgi:hypothetical protein
LPERDLTWFEELKAVQGKATAYQQSAQFGVLIRKVAPGAAIAFNTRPDDSADAAARGLALGSG